MRKPAFFNDLRQVRVERILSSKQNRLLTRPWMRRTLSLLAIVSSYFVLAALLIPTPYIRSKTGRIYIDYQAMNGNWLYDFRDFTQGAALFVLFWSFILLRISMRRVTLLPDEYLDELQITNRDWAYKTGYLVVRRIGFAVAVVFGLLATIGNQFTRNSAGYGTTSKALRALERYLTDLSTEDPFGFYFKAFLLLAFVAYSFPTILLAWREARFTERVPEIQETKELTEKEKDTNFYFTAIKWIVVSLAVFVSLWLTPKFMMFLGYLIYAMLTPLVYLVIPGGLILFTWASVTASKGVIQARRAGFKSKLQKRWANITTAFLTLTLLLGLVVGGAMLALISGVADNPRYPGMLPLALLCGVLMIPAQATSMMFYAKLDSK